MSSKNSKQKGPGVLLQLGLAGAVVAGLVAALSFARLAPNTTAGAKAAAAPPAADSATAPERPPSRWLVEARELLPHDGWVVADVAGKLVWSRPFATGPGEKPLGSYCESMPAPDRVAIALARSVPSVVASGTGGSAGLAPDELDIVLAAPRVTDDFFECVLAKVAQHGGKEPEQAGGYTVVESRSGLIVHSPEGHLWFSSNSADLERGLDLLRGRAPHAAADGPHGEIGRRLRGARTAGETMGLVTFDLPEGSLTDLNRDLPDDLSQLRRGGLVAFVDGGALGTVECPPAVCTRLASSLELLAKFAAKELPTEFRARTERALRFETIPGDALGRVVVTWTPNEIRVTELIEYVSARLGGGAPVAVDR